MTAHSLTTMTTNALLGLCDRDDMGFSCDPHGRPLPPPKHVVAQFEYATVRDAYSIGAKGLSDIVAWLAEDGLTLRASPPTPTPERLRLIVASLTRALLEAERAGKPVTVRACKRALFQARREFGEFG